MEVITQKFINYLSQFGLIKDETKKDFNRYYLNIFKKGNSQYKDKMTLVLLNYLNYMNKEKRKKICFNIVNQFFANDKVIKLFTLAILIHKSNSKIKKFKLLIQFQKWKKILYKINPSYNKKNYKKYPNTINKLNSSPYINTNIESEEKLNGQYHLQTSWETKGQKDFENSTTPKTNLSKSFNFPIHKSQKKPKYNKIPFYERLYKDSEKYANKREIRAQELDRILTTQTTFHPELYTKNYSGKKNKNDFIDRQKLFIDKKSQHKKQIAQKVEQCYQKDCPFNPKINISRIMSYETRKSSPVGIRLYEDSKARRNKSLKNIEEYNKKIDEQCNSFLYQRGREPYGAFDSERIKELYNDYKTKRENIELMKRNLNKEDGITFQPYLLKNNKYYNKIQSDIYERTQNLLDNKKNFIKNKNEERELRWKMNLYGYKETDYSPSEREKIIHECIERLWRNEKCKNIKDRDVNVGNKEEKIPYQDIIKQFQIESKGRVVNAQENEEKYNDQIISKQENIFGKMKKSKQNMVIGYNGNEEYRLNESQENEEENLDNEERNYLNLVDSLNHQQNGSYDDVYNLMNP